MGDQRGEEVWQVLDPELVQDQNAHEAGHEGRETYDVRQGGRREGKAGENDCEGLPRSKGEAERLIVAKRWCCAILPACLLVVGPPAEWARSVFLASGSANTLTVFVQLVDSLVSWLSRHIYMQSRHEPTQIHN